MFVLAGLGYSIRDMPAGIIKYSKRVDKIFLEKYTSISAINEKKLEKILRKKIHIVDRSFVEKKIYNLIGKENIMLLVPGNALVATPT